MFAVHLCESGADRATDFEPMFVEKWPLIQAFALDGFGG